MVNAHNAPGGILAAVMVRTLLISSLILAGCATRPACVAPMSAAVVETLYFGSDRKGEEAVTDDEWTSFVETIVTPELPQGFTTWGANGQWRKTDGTLDRERTHILQFVHAPSEDYSERLERIAADYRRRFDQDAVLRTSETACAKF